MTKPRAGVPPLTLDFGVRSDPEAAALSQGETLLRKGKRRAALAVFERYHSVDAQIGAAFARWPADGLDTVKRLVAAHPRNASAQLHLGLGASSGPGARPMPRSSSSGSRPPSRTRRRR